MEKGWPMDSTSTATKLLQKRRMMYQVKEEFDQAKQDQRDREVEFKKTQGYLRKKDLQLQQLLIHYNQVLQDNDLKRGKAKKKYDQEAKQKRMKQATIAELSQDINQLSIKAADLQREVQRMRKYQEFLQRVKQRNPDDFSDISDIRTRFKTLQDSYQELSVQRQQYDQQINHTRRMRDQYEKERKDQILELNIDIAVLQQRIEQADAQRIEIQNEIDQASFGATYKDMELGQMLTAIDNLYHRCKTVEKKIRHDRDIQRGEVKIDPNDFNLRAKTAVQKLSAIKFYITDLKEIIGSEEIKQAIEKAAGGSQHLKAIRRD